MEEKCNQNKERLAYFRSNMTKLHPAQVKLREMTANVTASIMLGSAESIQLLTTILKFAGAKKCIDIGVYTGYSSLSWALAIPDDGKVVALDISSKFPEVGKPVWKEAGVENKIDLRIGNAVESLNHMIENGETGTYDFAFIDADKTGYDAYFELCLKLVRKNGLIAIDNCWWSGQPLDDRCQDANTSAIRRLNEKIKADDRVTALLVDSGDGVYVCCKN